jgi:hypothetical protein
LEGNDCREEPAGEALSKFFQYAAATKQYAYNYGNWKLLKTVKTKQIWKCVDCSARLILEPFEEEQVVKLPVSK